MNNAEIAQVLEEVADVLAGLEPRHVLNTLPYEELRRAIERTGQRDQSPR